MNHEIDRVLPPFGIKLRSVTAYSDVGFLAVVGDPGEIPRSDLAIEKAVKSRRTCS